MSVMSSPVCVRMPDINVAVGDALTRVDDDPGTVWIVEAADEKFFVTNLYVFDETYMKVEKVQPTPRTYINMPHIKTLKEQGFYKVTDYVNLNPME